VVLDKRLTSYLLSVLIKNMNKNKMGFTLFELLVSISIIAILTAIASMSFSGAQRKARDSRRVSDMNTVQKALEQYYSFSSYTYPLVPGKWTATNGQVVLEVFPIDPKGVGVSYLTTMDVNGYCICGQLENNIGNSADAGCGAFVNGTGGYYCIKNQQ